MYRVCSATTCWKTLVFLVLSYFYRLSASADVIVSTKYGQVKGRQFRSDYGLGSDSVTETYDRFLGIPYAKPPIGKLRFQPPQEPDPWSDVLDATTHRSVCLQMEYSDTHLHSLHQSESCLFLNVFTPYKGSSDERYPVMVYFHGGSYEVGSGKTYDGSVLVQMGVVVVTINYRLGALGFLTSGDPLLPGNYGLQDQALTLKWIKENIARFRGDPDRVTLFGHSVGASSVGLMTLLSTAKPGLFHGVIAQSGVATASYTSHRPSTANFTRYIRLVGQLFSCTDDEMAAIVECIRAIDAKKFLEKRIKFPLFDPIDPEFRPFVDGRILADDPRTLFQKGRFLQVPVLAGTVKDEFANYFNGGARHRREFDEALDKYLVKELKYSATTLNVVKFQYTDWNDNRTGMHYDAWSDDSHSMKYLRGDLLSDMHMVAPTVDMCDVLSKHVPVYQYHFSADSSYHSVELNYVFGAPFSGVFADEMTVNGTVDSFCPRQRNLSLQIMKLWTSFARHGRPVSGSVEWTAYTSDDRNYLLLSPGGIGMRRNLRSEKVTLWNQLVPILMANSSAYAMSPVKDSLSQQQIAPVNLWILLTSIGVLVVVVLLLTALVVRLMLENRRFKRANASGYVTKQQI